MSTFRGLEVFDISDPLSPQRTEIVGHVVTDTRTHTASCGTPTCEYAYTDGRSQGEISIVDLTNFRDPKMAGTYRSVVPQGDDQDLDEAGVLWHVGGQGTVALDISDPVNPIQLNSTTRDGMMAPWNRFIHHNSYRPNANAFAHLTDADGTPVRDEHGHLQSGAPSITNGNVVLVTEEYLATNGNRRQPARHGRDPRGPRRPG